MEVDDTVVVAVRVRMGAVMVTRVAVVDAQGNPTLALHGCPGLVSARAEALEEAPAGSAAFPCSCAGLRSDPRSGWEPGRSAGCRHQAHPGQGPLRRAVPLSADQGRAGVRALTLCCRGGFGFMKSAYYLITPSVCRRRQGG